MFLIIFHNFNRRGEYSIYLFIIIDIKSTYEDKTRIKYLRPNRFGHMFRVIT
jgi:hypothetical protein